MFLKVVINNFKFFEFEYVALVHDGDLVPLNSE